jgi:selenocysteine lyase/cysteine desulfurase
MPVDWNAIRGEFPALNHWTYLNTATLGLIANGTRAAVDAHFRRRDEFANTDFAAWWDDTDRLRATIALCLGCSAADIAFIPNASAALALALTAVKWRDGDEILTLRDEFPNQTYATARLAGVRLIETDLERIYDALTPRTRMVVLSSVNYQTGLRAPWEAMVKVLRERGIFFYVDGTQSFGALVTDLAAAGPDMFAVNCYKWACAPPGAAFMYVHPDVRKYLQPAVVGWRSDAGWRDQTNLKHSDPVFSPAAEKYEGGLLAFPSLYGLQASLDHMLAIGPANIEQRVLMLAKAGGGDGSSNIVTLPMPADQAPALVARLKEARIVVAARRGKLRISPHFYNNEEDMRHVRAVLTASDPGHRLPDAAAVR